MECIYKNADESSAGPPGLERVPAVVKECAEPLLEGVGLRLFAAAYPLVKIQIEEKSKSNDQLLDKILGGGQTVVVAYPAGVTTTTTTTSTTTTAPRAPVMLAVDSLGVVSFGTEMDHAITAITSSLGSPDYTGSWHVPYCSTDPRGGRLIIWGQLSVYFGEGPGGRRVLRGYEFSDRAYDHGARREVPVVRRTGLRTPSGAGLGVTGAELEGIYAGRVRAQRGDPTGFPPPSYVVSVSATEHLFFIMDGNGPQARVTRISAGGGCGE